MKNNNLSSKRSIFTPKGGEQTLKPAEAEGAMAKQHVGTLLLFYYTVSIASVHVLELMEIAIICLLPKSSLSLSHQTPHTNTMYVIFENTKLKKMMLALSILKSFYSFFFFSHLLRMQTTVSGYKTP